jgi:diacylglycerol kinase family enzyme/membrane-associated phospholipid phosphatase
MDATGSQQGGQCPAARRGWPDGFSVVLSRAADHSVLWIAASVLLAAGGRRARSGAVRGLAAIAVTSVVSNGLLKPLFRRQRPGHPEPLVPRPGSFAFPSGHSASAFAFAAAVCWHVPALAPVLGPLAGAVACSRVRTGVHHRADVVAGSVLGTAIGLAVTTARATRRPRQQALFPEAVLVTSSRVSHSRDYAAARSEMHRLGVAVTAGLDLREIGRLPGLLAARGPAPVLVIAAGGDGTAGAVADVLAGTGHVLGLLPLGTSNNFARSLGIPVDPRGAVGLFGAGKVAAVDLGRYTPEGEPPRYFAHAATVGLNAGFAKIATRADIRDRLGRFTYLLAAARALRKRHPFTAQLCYAGRNERLTLAQLSVINAPRFGGPLRLSVPDSDPDDRLLDILTVQDLPPSRMLAAVLPVLLRSGRPVPGITIRHAARVSVSAGEPLEVTLDGEIAGTLPGSFEVAGNALRVITPRSFIDKDDDNQEMTR